LPAAIAALFVTAYADPLTVFFIDPGYDEYSGDAMLVRTPSGQAFLVDGGDSGSDPPWDCGESRVLSLLDSLGITRLDGIVATHPHSDHVAGLVSVLDSIPVDEVWDSGWPYSPTPAYEDFLSAVEASGAAYSIVRRGDILDWGAGLEVEVLHPVDPLQSSEMNNASIVLRISHGQIDFLLCGDIYTDGGEDVILDALAAGVIDAVDAEVLKVAHHGSSTSTGTAWLAAVDPVWAAIEVGAGNPYGHPHGEVLSRLYGRDIDVFRTDLLGTFFISTDGDTLCFNTLPGGGGGGGGGPGTDDLAIWPSPATSHATFHWTAQGAGPARLRIWNLAGECILDVEPAGGSYEWDLGLESGGLASPGLYAVLVETDEESWTECFAVTR
jgi:beta-lactamase superfamily II metal-dependent hydrolase